MTHALFAFMGIGPMEMLIVLLVGVLLFGKRLPEVGRSLGKGIMEFKKGVRGLEDELDAATSTSPTRSSTTSPAKDEIDDRDEATAPKFEPPTAEPKADTSADQPQPAITGTDRGTEEPRVDAPADPAA